MTSILFEHLLIRSLNQKNEELSKLNSLLFTKVAELKHKLHTLEQQSCGPAGPPNGGALGPSGPSGPPNGGALGPSGPSGPSGPDWEDFVVVEMDMSAQNK